MQIAVKLQVIMMYPYSLENYPYTKKTPSQFRSPRTFSLPRTSKGIG